MKIKHVCWLLQMNERRILHWRKRRESLEDRTPGPMIAPHARLVEEKVAIL